MDQIPNSVLAIIGVMVLSNLGSIAAMVYSGLKVAWWFSKLDSRVDKAQETAVRAHQRIDKIGVDHG